MLTLAFVSNGIGLRAWRQGLLGRWYPGALCLSTLALLADPMSLPGIATAGAVGALLLGAVGLVVASRLWKHDTTQASSR